MSAKCSAVVFSNKAYNAIIRETFEHEPIETGGILLGHIVNDTWVVMEVLPPGIHSIFQMAYFEYDEEFVNYLAHSVANQYKQPLLLLGLWHRHPGSMDTFSGTDDQTNRTFARQLPQGVISGLVNVDPRFRFTMYYLDKDVDRGFGRPPYEQVDVEVGDDIIPPQFFTLRYFDNAETSDLHPTANASRETNYNRNACTHVNPQHRQQQQPNTPFVPQENEEEGAEEGLQDASGWDLFCECCKRLFRLIIKFWKEVTIAILFMVVVLFTKDRLKDVKFFHRDKDKNNTEQVDKKTNKGQDAATLNATEQEEQQAEGTEGKADGKERGEEGTTTEEQKEA